MKTSFRPVQTLCFFLFALLISTSAGAAKIYTWTDANGVVHYVDQPPENSSAKEIEAAEAYRPGSVAAPANDAATETDSPDSANASPAVAEAPEAELSYADQKRAEMARKREARNEAKSERAAECALAQQQLARVEPNRRVFYTDENGETVRVNDDDRIAMVEDAKKRIAENCD